MKTIQVTSKGVQYQIKVDDDDFGEFSKYKWSIQKGRNTFYAHRGIKTECGKWTTITMHRVIMQLKNSEENIDLTLPAASPHYRFG